MKKKRKPKNSMQASENSSYNKGFKPDEYYYDEHGRIVMTEIFHLRKGYCCKNGCKHCPYGFNKEKNENGS